MKRVTSLLALLICVAGFVHGESTFAQSTGTPSSKPKPHLTRVRVHNVKIRISKTGFHPNHVTINQGDQIKFELTSADVAHGFSIPDFNIRIDVPSNQITLLPFEPQQSGEFVFVCDVACGDGYSSVQGKLIVTPSQ